MNNLEVKRDNFLVMDEASINKVRSLENYLLSLPDNGTIPTEHVLHAGMYSRTIRVPKGHVVAGAFTILPTLLIISGHCAFFAGEKAKELKGYHVLVGFANRKQALAAIEDTCATMVFATTAKTVEEAEDQFTNEPEMLWSRRVDAINTVTVSGV